MPASDCVFTLANHIQTGALVRASGPNIIMFLLLVLTSEDVRTILDALKAGFAAI